MIMGLEHNHGAPGDGYRRGDPRGCWICAAYDRQYDEADARSLLRRLYHVLAVVSTCSVVQSRIDAAERRLERLGFTWLVDHLAGEEGDA